MIFLRTCEGALKWRLRFVLQPQVTKGLNFMLNICSDRRGKERRVLSRVPGPTRRKGEVKGLGVTQCKASLGEPA